LFSYRLLIVPPQSCTQRITPKIYTPITVNSISGVHNVLTETGGNRQIQHQLITPPTPTHLNVEDTLLGPLTPGQVARLAAGMSLGYLAWDQLTLLSDPLRAALAAMLALAGVLAACCRPAGVAEYAWAAAWIPPAHAEPMLSTRNER
jgi:hypothetical protein